MLELIIFTAFHSLAWLCFGAAIAARGETKLTFACFAVVLLCWYWLVPGLNLRQAY